MSPQPSARALGEVADWVFDLDNTLYPARCRLFDQVDRRIGLFIQNRLGLDAGAARVLQKHYFHQHGTTLCGLMTHHGVEPEVFLQFVHDIDVSAVEPSPALDSALARLPGRKFIFTNGSNAHAARVMDRLGVARRFDGVFDIADAGYVPKPAQATYERLLSRHTIEPARAVMIEDLPRNLRPAAALGMTTVLVLTGEEWAETDSAGDHIHHVTDDLVSWLGAHAPARGAGGQAS
jgi:putative hydrolase of the HAD superfamily